MGANPFRQKRADGLAPVSNAEFSVDALQLLMDGPGTTSKSPSDLLARFAREDLHQDFPFHLGEPVTATGLVKGEIGDEVHEVYS
jgi:hypothetical protein